MREIVNRRWPKRLVKRMSGIGVGYASVAALEAPGDAVGNQERYVQHIAHIGRCTAVPAGPYRVQLVEMLPGVEFDFQPENAGDILCFELEAFGLDTVIAWVEQAQARRIEVGELPLCIMVLGDEAQLTPEDMWRISEELEPAGAIFHSWPDDSRGFAGAFCQLAKSIGALYSLTKAPELSTVP